MLFSVIFIVLVTVNTTSPPYPELDAVISFHKPAGYHWSDASNEFSSAHSISNSRLQRDCTSEPGSINCYYELNRKFFVKYMVAKVTTKCRFRWYSCKSTIHSKPPRARALALAKLNSVSLHSLVGSKPSSGYRPCWYNELPLQDDKQLPKALIIGVVYISREIHVISYSVHSHEILTNKTIKVHNPLSLKSGVCDFIYTYHT
ncbi:hypothetical protein DSO57_1025369 [Entomophthora muscae]|uniref:Uncharacterized protein n=1 Tax=Entomophthora muscae TaxID=34485 RepID=A0ACC2UC08_9FUNG|nr:hypothetical protein DSO57_1025369 [Entomophthora muscae]